MRRFTTLALTAAAAAFVTTAAGAADYAPPVLRASAPAVEPASSSGGWYLRGDIGVGMSSIGDWGVYQDGQQVRSGAGGVDTFQLRTKSFSETVSIGFGAGYQFNSWFRVDVTGEFRGGGRLRGHDYVSWSGGGDTFHQTNTYQGDVRSWAMMANFYVDLGTFCTFGCLTPYLGAGVGFAHHTVSAFTDSSTGYSTLNGATGSTGAYAATSSKASFAWALMAGVGYRVSERLSLELGYRYINLGDMPTLGLIDNVPQPGGPVNTIQVRNLSAHEVRIGMRWLLNCSCGTVETPVVARY